MDHYLDHFLFELKQLIRISLKIFLINYLPPYENQSYPYPTFYTPLYVAILSIDSTNSTPFYAISATTPIPTKTETIIPNATHYLNVHITFGLGTDGLGHVFINNVTYSSDANYMHMRDDPTIGFTSDLYSPLVYQMVEKNQ
ncbi:unnamed protein product [Adineta ricciae]|uniref:Uncharacterized protein n=1 Tax=Adineta ricciae TaxID=249248 RepID=A0A816HDY9_ADIRI|nr:unnamed protein product [Adineta ricciae]